MFDSHALRENVTFSLRLLTSLYKIATQQTAIPGATEQIGAGITSLRELAVRLEKDPIPTEVLRTLFGRVYLQTFDLLWASAGGTIDRGKTVLDQLETSVVAEDTPDYLPTLNEVVETFQAMFAQLPRLQEALLTDADLKVYDLREHQLVTSKAANLCLQTTRWVADENEKAGVIEKQDLRYQVFISFGAAYQSALQCNQILEQLGHIQSELVRRSAQLN